MATDATTAPFFSYLISTNRIVSLFSFYEIRLIFSATDDRNSFCLLTLGAAIDVPKFAFSILQPADIADERRVFELSPDQIISINPNTKTVPIFRSRADAELTAKLYRNVPILIRETREGEENPWNIEFMTMFHMSNDSGHFHKYRQLESDAFTCDGADMVSSDRRFLPLYEAKMIHQFDHRWAGYNKDGMTTKDALNEDKADPYWEPMPRYWLSKSDITSRLDSRGWTRNWIMGWRDITNATAANTVIAAVIPRKATNHKLPLFFCNGYESKQHALLANLNSIILDYAAKQKVAGTNLTYFYLKQFPVLPPNFYTSARLAFITPKVLELSYTSYGLMPFAQDLGYDRSPYSWNQDRRGDLRADLDAFYARAYGLTRDELRYILDPADVKGADYPSETFRVLKDKEIRQYGEYRTRRLVLAAWDRMEADGVFAELGLSDDVVGIAAHQMQLPALNTISDGVWAWSQGGDERDRVRVQLRAVAGIMPDGVDARCARLATLACLYPDLLNGFLSATDQVEWQRIVGLQATPSAVVSALTPPTNAAWGAAYNELVSAAVLDVSADGGSWSAGPRLDRSTLHADDPAVGRALFAWSRLQSIDLEQGIAGLSADIIPFIREGRLAA